VLLLSLWAWAGTLPYLAGSEGRAGYVGAERCKLCHREIYQSWAETPHRRASDPISTAPGEVRCLDCHGTPGREREGVQCEACHGAGENYSAPEVMIDVEKAVSAGLVRPATESCARCHENDEPGHRRRLTMPARAQWPFSIHVEKRRE
jgi:hypothetical protein